MLKLVEFGKIFEGEKLAPYSLTYTLLFLIVFSLFFSIF